MKKKKLYNMDLSEFSDLIDNMRIELKSKDLEYKKLTNEYYKILKDFPNLQKNYNYCWKRKKEYCLTQKRLEDNRVKSEKENNKNKDNRLR